MWIFCLPHNSHRSDRILGKIDWCVFVFVCRIRFRIRRRERQTNVVWGSDWQNVVYFHLDYWFSLRNVNLSHSHSFQLKQTTKTSFCFVAQYHRLDLTRHKNDSWLAWFIQRLLCYEVTRNTIIMSFMGKNKYSWLSQERRYKKGGKNRVF